MTPDKVHDKNVAESIRLPSGSVVVFDRAYIDYQWLSNLDSRSIIFVTRAKDNMGYTSAGILPFNKKKHPQVVDDRKIALNGSQSKNKYKGKLRWVRYLDSKTGKCYTFLTNQLTWDAQTVADVYKERWHIEVFFKQVKQHLKINLLLALVKTQYKFRYGPR